MVLLMISVWSVLLFLHKQNMLYLKVCSIVDLLVIFGWLVCFTVQNFLFSSVYELSSSLNSIISRKKELKACFLLVERFSLEPSYEEWKVLRNMKSVLFKTLVSS